MAIDTYIEIMRANSQRPPAVVHAQDPRVQTSGTVTRLTLDLLDLADPPMRLVVLNAIGSWAEISWTEPTTTVGVQFWGDSNDGIARVLVNGKEEWRGSTQGANVTFEQYIAISGLPNRAHTVRVEAITDAAFPSGGNDVAVAAFGWGTAGDVSVNKVFLPFIANSFC